MVIFDRTDFGPSNLSLPDGHCRSDPNELVLKIDCTAHSILYDVASNTFRPLTIQTDTFCSSGAVLPDGRLVQTGGYNDGDHVIRTFSPCSRGDCDWTELPENLTIRRWYASNQILPDGRIIIVGGRRAFSYEFFPANESRPGNFYLRFLKETRDPKEENNLYPFLHLLPDGNLFIFANTRSILFDYKGNRVLKEFPSIPGGDKRNYPSTGSSVLLPLRLTGSDETHSPDAEILVCGGASPGAFRKASHGIYVAASRSCGRIKVTDNEPQWVMEDMPMPRVMPDMLLLPTGDVIIINGAGNGTAGWESAINPVLHPVLYLTNEPDPTQRFVLLNPTTIPRMYHSAAALLADGCILVGGSNPHVYYNFSSDVLYPTELSLESFAPPYSAPAYSHLRPSILSVERSLSYGQMFSLTFVLPLYQPEYGVSVTIVTPSFSTHSFAMSQRLVVLNVIDVDQLSVFGYSAVVSGPTSDKIAPPGYYMLFVVHVGIPSHGVWVKIQ